LQDAEESLTLGAGLYYPVVGNILFRFDFAYVDFGLFDNVYKYTLGIDF
jgi:opacity protein-like surface antigen